MNNVWLDPTVNEVTAGGVSPSGGPSVAAAATGSNVKRALTGSGGNANTTPGQGTPQVSIVTGLIVFLVLTLLIMFVAHKWGGEEGDFKNIRGSAYNVLFVALVAVTGIPVLKIVFTKFADWGLPFMQPAKQWVMAA